uniref:Uncharacterized protein n=2 Tax=Proboscia inermis TaxID=420281 RepID=A0A7S0CC47_9STRA|mmetsp:Transcript_39616/g.40192  ORF Transcript_39616/g.40192 Transcript_39616/m.40192 type:complete len:296 (+) Transcript_39616:112-999(+)
MISSIENSLTENLIKHKFKSHSDPEVSTVCTDVKSCDNDGASEINESNGDEKKISMFTFILNAVLSAGVVVSILAMALNTVPLVIGSMVFPIILAPYASHQNKILSENDGMKTLINKLRKSANNLITQNDVLHREVGKVKEEVDKLESCESALSDIAATQSQDVRFFIDLVKGNKETLASMKESLQASIMADVMEMVLVSDRNGDFKLDANEVDHLILRMNSFEGLEFDDKEFRKVIQTKELDIQFIILLVKDMIDDSNENKILKVNAEKFVRKKREKMMAMRKDRKFKILNTVI